jgi:hypothetical protein
MTAGTARLIELLRDLLATSAESRGLAADSVIDWLAAFGVREAAVVSQILLWLARVEQDGTAMEAELHALAEMAEHGLVPADVLSEVRELPRASLQGSAVEHYDYLRSLSADNA